jgi:hypothetical protein
MEASVMDVTEPWVFSDEEWGLLVGLPQGVVVAATSAEADGAARTRAEATAGLTAISAGRESASPLVARVAEAVVAQAGDPEEGEEPPVIQPADPAPVLADVIERARRASALLAEHVEESEAAAYKHWLVEVAEEVVTAAKSGGVLGIGGELVTAAEQQFLHDLGVALGD